ncbi:MAG: 4'-phosphopantetheinyl transferase family protein [Lachnospiraceae bacterium]
MQRVKVVIAKIKEDFKNLEEKMDLIAPYYRERYLGTKIQSEARQALASGLLLKKYLDVDSNEQLTYNAFHKPFLSSGKAYFNLSHSEEYVVLAVSEGLIGVDVEKIMEYHDATAKKIFSTSQREYLLDLPSAERNEYFTKLWTEFEAVLKLKGTGFCETWAKESPPILDYPSCSIRVEDYFISCATEKKATMETEIIDIKKLEE